MTRQGLIQQIREKKSFLCVGLDTDMDKIPAHLLKLEDPIFEFNKAIIDATKDLCVAYKPNVAFYEALGPKGWESLKKTIDYIPSHCLTIADAKRGDIGNTSTYYAKTFFEYLNCDAVTVAPYMGEDSVTPFQEFKNKWVILLALTSNKGALDFQFTTDSNGEELYKKVLKKSSKWGSEENLMYVVGATRAEGIAEVRKIVPNHFFLVPGVGAQGGSLEDVAKYGWNNDCGLLVNASRSIIYASNGTDFAEKGREEAKKLQQEMELILKEKHF
ncbi:orotidine-5'-phosphate decarboxylase [Fluviicola taffensis]|uniref:Orotidine-5'-phosphate decarboxylase n=1 Tax=Fluviicola taffensis (strain DSM 16823 / NCIMB 13979 / RW262) TaxID=755732 RepID=F2I9D5_FLUTR|nr:orotidine-5'-phosphate decarboxylase [Fluviicola taffensis]AEA44092.1 orotidine 5'-phosphate decarboxylase [Fluviicola taffensis DSM 16823]